MIDKDIQVADIKLNLSSLEIGEDTLKLLEAWAKVAGWETAKSISESVAEESEMIELELVKLEGDLPKTKSPITFTVNLPEGDETLKLLKTCHKATYKVLAEKTLQQAIENAEIVGFNMIEVEEDNK